jgi:hypothetical protein
MTVSRVLIRGDGIAARTCAHLLGQAGLAARIEPLRGPRVPAVMLSDPAIALIRDVFAVPDLYARQSRINRRVVAWGEAVATPLPHGAAVLSETELLGVLPVGAAPEAGFTPDLIIHAAPQDAPLGAQRRFGTRRAVAVQVQLIDPDDGDGCWIESLPDGWLFLIPDPAGRSWLLGVGGELERLLSLSHLIAPRVAVMGSAAGTFDACPRIADTLAGEGWIACGTAAVAFDPICGDGTAQAVREAILASAVIAALAEGGDAASLRGHYQSMLIATMRRHLQLCMDFYRRGGAGAWWDGELRALVQGHAWCTEQLRTAPEPAYLLKDFRLVSREAA